MIDILNLALPYFGLIFIGFACGRSRGLPEAGLAWMNFFLLYASLPALLFGIMSKTPFEELNNPPFLIATTLGMIVLNPLIMSACAGALAAALHIHPPVGIDNTLLFLQNVAAPVALFVLGVTVALRSFGRVPWEAPGVIAVKLLIHPLVVFGLIETLDDPPRRAPRRREALAHGQTPKWSY
jgi:predicted permease